METIAVKASTAYEELAYFSAGEMMAMVSLTAPKFTKTSRAPIDAVAVIDRSGSMSGIKLELVKKTLHFMTSQLQVDDRLSLVTFDDSIRTDLPLTQLNSEGKFIADLAINNIVSGNSTDICGGLLQGVNELRKRDKKAEVSSVLMFTDGLANVGLQSAEDINKALIDPAFAEKSYGSKIALQKVADATTTIPLPGTINTFGYGADHNSTILKTIAQKADGVYFYVETPEEIPRSFADCLGGLISTGAKNVVIRIEAGTGVTISKILTTYAVTEIAAGGVYEITFADLQSQEHRDVLMNLQIPAIPNSVNELALAKVSISYLNIITKEQVNIPSACVMKIARPVQTGDLKFNYDIDKHYNRIIAADAMAAATVLGNANKLDEAKSTIGNVIKRIKESVSANDTFCQNLVIDLNRILTGLESREVYQRRGHNELENNYVAHTNQRSTNRGWGCQGAYQNDERDNLNEALDENE